MRLLRLLLLLVVRLSELSTETEVNERIERRKISIGNRCTIRHRFESSKVWSGCIT